MNSEGKKPQINWKGKEVNKLRQMKQQGYTYNEIAIELNRTIKSCSHKYLTL